MSGEKLGNDIHYKFTADEVFGSSSGNVIGFTEHDYSRAMHYQEFCEINMILAGEGMHYVGEGRLPVSKGDVFIIPPDLHHGYMGGKGFDVYHLLISPTFLEKHSADLMQLPAFSALFKVEPAMRERFCTDLHLKLTDYELSSLLPLLEDIHSHSYKDTPEDIIISASEAMILIARLCAVFSSILDSEQAASGTGSDEAFMRSIAHIYERYYDKIRIDELAAISKMSRTSYLKRFKSFTGTSPGEFILRHRIDAASKMLSSTTDSITDIAVRNGFYDTAHFIHTFTARIGISPLEYRRKTRNAE